MAILYFICWLQWNSMGDKSGCNPQETSSLPSLKIKHPI